MAARHGVGREPGDGKLWLSVLAALSATRSLRSGFRVYLTPNPAFRRIAAPRWAMILSPLRAQISATLTLRKLLAKVQFVVESKQYFLIAGAIKARVVGF